MVKTLLRNHWPALGWALLIFISSSIPAEKLPDVGKSGFDKIVHFVMYFVLAAAIHWSVRHQMVSPWARRYELVCTVLLTTLYGLTDEIHQAFVPNRNTSILDLAADIGGAALYVAMFWLLFRKRLFEPES